MFPSEIAKEVRNVTNRQDSNFPTDTEMFRFISNSQQKVFRALHKVAPQTNAEDYDFMRSSSQARYDLPVDYGGYMLRAQDISDTPNSELDLVTFRHLEEDQGSDTDRVAKRGNKIQLGPEPNVNDSSDTIRITYSRQPENVHAGTLESTKSTSVQFSSDPSTGVLHNFDSAYVNHEIEITDGAGIGQRRKIDGYTASNRVATVANSFDTVPSTTDSYEIIVEVPNVARDALVAHVSKKVMGKDEWPDNAEVRDYNTEIQDAQSLMANEGFHRSPNRGTDFIDTP